MAGTRSPDYELGRRVAAARAYRDVDQQTVAEKLGVGRDTLGRYERGKIDKRYKREGLIEIAAQVTQLPHEFFAIDFKELPLMEKAWRQAQRLPRPEDLEAIVDRALNGDSPPE
jgi:transcriptional regulator with XRE-family HTH domain